jgi:hypothetical protein
VANSASAGAGTSTKIANAADDAAGGGADARAWVPFLEALAGIAREISYAEAGDTGEVEARRRVLAKIEDLRVKLDEAEASLRSR